MNAPEQKKETPYMKSTNKNDNKNSNESKYHLL